MKILNVAPENINDRVIAEVARALDDGKIVIYPTDTLYAIGCDALNNAAIEEICQIKAMKSAKTNLTIVCSDISQVSQYAKVSNEHFRLMKQYLPGPFTFVLQALSKLQKAFKGRKTVGVRIPSNKITTKLVESLGRPILSTSVEGIDDDYLCEPGLIAETYNNVVEYVIDAGRSESMVSTVVDCTGSEPEVIREGKGIIEL